MHPSNRLFFPAYSPRLVEAELSEVHGYHPRPRPSRFYRPELNDVIVAAPWAFSQLWRDTPRAAREAAESQLWRGQPNGTPRRLLPYTIRYTNLDVIGRDVAVRCGHFSLYVSDFSAQIEDAKSNS